MDSSLYDSEEERLGHLSAIHRLASEALNYGIGNGAIESLYETELAKLKETARIKTYLSVFTTRRVKSAWKQNLL